MPLTIKQINARSGALVVIDQVFTEGAYTNIAVNQYLRKYLLNDQERRLMTELVYGTVKAKGTLDWYLQKCISRPLKQVEHAVLNILRLSLYQLRYMDRIPASAACNEAVKLARLVSHEGSAKFVNGVLRGYLRRAEELQLPQEDEAEYLGLLYFHPRWLVKKWLSLYGREATEKLLAFNNTAAPVCLRANTLAISRAALMDELINSGGEAVVSRLSEDGIVCQKLPALGSLFNKLQDGFYVQDESSMVVADVVAPEPGQLVIDLCSAPGGKATHLAQRMANRGRIMACDVHEHKLELIAANARRLRLDIIEPVLQDGTVLRPELIGSADRVLVDAPCSGLGVLRRRAEGRWSKNQKELGQFPAVQRQLLHNGSRYVKANGRLVYSTCTIELAENHYVIEEFLAKHKEWEREPIRHPLTGEMVEELQLLPHVDGCDGFFICALRRKG